MQPLLKKIPGSAPVELIWVYFVAVCPSPTKLNLTTLLHVYLSFSPSLILVTSAKRLFLPRSFPTIYPHKIKDNSLGLVTDTTPSGFIARHRGSFRYSFIRFGKKKKTKSSPQLFQDSEC